MNDIEILDNAVAFRTRKGVPKFGDSYIVRNGPKVAIGKLAYRYRDELRGRLFRPRLRR